MSRISSLWANINEQLEAMSPRDRNLLLGLVTGLMFLATVGITLTLKGAVTDRESRVEVATSNLETAQVIAAEYGELQQQLTVAEGRMSTFNPGQFNTYIESWAASAGVREGLKEVKEDANEVVGDFRRREYSVRIDRMPLENVLKFLYAVETSDFPIQVRNSEFRVKKIRDGRLVDLSLKIESYAKEEG